MCRREGIVPSPASFYRDKSRNRKRQKGAKRRAVVLRTQSLVSEQEVPCFHPQKPERWLETRLWSHPLFQFGAAEHNLTAFSPLSWQIPPQETLGTSNVTFQMFPFLSCCKKLVGFGKKKNG